MSQISEQNNSILGKINTISRILFHVSAIVILFGEFLCILSWEKASIGYFIRNTIWFVLLLLIIEQFFRSIPKGIISAAALAITIFTYYQTQSIDYFFREYIIFYLLSDLTDTKLMRRMLFVLYLLIPVYLILLNATGLVNNIQVQFPYALGNSYGFGHPNSLGAITFSLVVVLRATVLRKHRILFILACIAGIAFAWFAAACRTVVILLVLYPIAEVVVEWYCKKNTRPKLFLMAFVPVIFFLISLGITIYCLHNSIPAADDNMMARFTSAARFIWGNGATAFGHSLNNAIMDNGYMRVMLERGIIPVLLFVASLVFLIYRAGKRKDSKTAAIWCIYCLYGVMEGVLLMPIHNVLVLFALAEDDTAPIRYDITQLKTKTKTITSGIILLICTVSVFFLPQTGTPIVRYEQKEYNNTSSTAVINEKTSISQSFERDYTIRSVRLLMSTYGTQAKGDYFFSLIDHEGTLLDIQQIPGERIIDCDYLEVIFNKPYPAGKYIISIHGKNCAGDSVGIWQNDYDPFPDGEASVNGWETNCDLNYAIGRQIIDENQIIKSILILAGIYILVLMWIPGRRKEENQ